MVIFTMIKIYAYTCLLSVVALSLVEMKILNVNGRVGGSVTFTCSGWDVWFGVKDNDKYLCNNPCSADEHIIITAAFGKTTKNNRIELTNTGKGLSVIFNNLQKSDSKIYYCGVDKFGRDSLIKVNLKVTDAVSPRPKTTPKTNVVASTLSFAVTESSTMSSGSPDIISHNSTSNTTLNTHTASATQEYGSMPYLIIGVIVIITMLIVLLKVMSKLMKKQLKVVSRADTPQEDEQVDVHYDEIRPEDQTDPDCLYANCSYIQDTKLAAESGNSKDVSSTNSASRFEANSRAMYADSRVTGPGCDLIYSVAQLPKEQIETTVQSEPDQSESYENDFLYSLAQPPQST